MKQKRMYLKKTCSDKTCKDYLYHQCYCYCECLYGRKMSKKSFKEMIDQRKYIL